MSQTFIFTGEVLKKELLYEYGLYSPEGESLKEWLGKDYNDYLAIDDEKYYRTDAQLSYWEEIVE